MIITKAGIQMQLPTFFSGVLKRTSVNRKRVFGNSSYFYVICTSHIRGEFFDIFNPKRIKDILFLIVLRHFLNLKSFFFFFFTMIFLIYSRIQAGLHRMRTIQRYAETRDFLVMRERGENIIKIIEKKTYSFINSLVNLRACVSI